MSVDNALLHRIPPMHQMELDAGYFSGNLQKTLEKHGITLTQQRVRIIDSDGQFGRDLDSQSLSANLKQEFADGAYPLSESTTISVEKRGRQWLITDTTPQRMYRIIENGKKLDAYELFQDVTVEDRGSEWSITERKNSWKLSFYNDFTPQIINDLDLQNLPADLVQRFADKGYPLSLDATVSIQDSGSEWLITDENRIYLVRKGKSRLSVRRLESLVSVVYSIRRVENELHVYGSLFRKLGKFWRPQELEDVYDWLVWQGHLDKFVHFAHKRISLFVPPLGTQQAYQMAQETVADKIDDVISSDFVTYDSSRYLGNKHPFLNWLYHIIAREAKRRAKREADRIIHEEKQIAQLLKKQQEQLDQIPDLDWKSDKVQCYMRGYVNRLSEKYKEAITLYYFDGLSIAEAANQSQWPCSTNAMKTRLCRARQELCLLLLRLMKAKGIRLSPEHEEAIEFCITQRMSRAEAGQKSRWQCSEEQMKKRLSDAFKEIVRRINELDED